MKKSITVILVLFLVIQLAAVWLETHKSKLIISPYPNGKNFAFSVTDDPDKNKLDKKKIVYDFLIDTGFKITTLVWVKRAQRTNMMPIRPVTNYRYGDTIEKIPYLNYIKKLHDSGFEIGTHTITAGADLRDETLHGYETFKSHFNRYPRMVVMHSHNLDNLHWGKYVFDNPILQMLAGTIVDVPYGGHDPESPYFWGDFAKEHIKYVRLWGTPAINTLSFNPSMPYTSAKKKYINYLFSFSDGHNGQTFTELISDENIDKLESERGTSLVYTHFADGFVDDYGNLLPDFELQMRKLAHRKQGWFAPASDILDRLSMVRNVIVERREDYYYIINTNNTTLLGLTLLVRDKDKPFFRDDGSEIIINEENELVIDRIDALQFVRIHTTKPDKKIAKSSNGRTPIKLYTQNAIVFLNPGPVTVENTAVPFSPGKKYFADDGTMLSADNQNVLVIDAIAPYGVYPLFEDRSGSLVDTTLGLNEKIQLVIGRVMVFLKHGHFLKAKWWQR